ncbi:MAG: FAD:protein FMN transferase [Verrucomicrobia bacterium]|nr:FAD:protein FMN transferase [Verrucomicrobiota bacterium]
MLAGRAVLDSSTVFAAAPDAKPISLTGLAMGTSYSIQYLPATNTPAPETVRRAAAALLERLEQQMSTYRTNSELSRFNDSRSTNWFAVSPELAQVVGEAQRVSQLTGGAFDVTVNPLVRLWGFGPNRRTGEVPRAAAIAAARTRVDFRKLEVRREPAALRKTDPALTVDLSGIAKGFAVDELAAELKKLGVKNFLVNLAGEIKARGNSAAGRAWRVGVERPVENGRDIGRVVELRNLGLSTSGDYRNFFEARGRRFHHVIDPRTGWPADGGAASVSVAHASNATADALATALAVLGPKAGLELARHEKLAALFVIRQGNQFTEIMTPAFAGLLPK